MPGGYKVSQQWALGPGECLSLKRDHRGTHLPMRGPAKASGTDAEGTVWLPWLDMGAANAPRGPMRAKTSTQTPGSFAMCEPLVI